MHSSTVSARQFATDANPVEELSNELRRFQSATSRNAPLISSQTYFQQLQRMLNPDVMRGVELSESNTFEVISRNQKATGAGTAASFDASPLARYENAALQPAREHLNKLFQAGWELDSGEVVSFETAPDIKSKKATPATARQFDLKPVKEKTRRTQSWIDWDNINAKSHALPGDIASEAQSQLRDRSAWFAAAACTDNTVAMVRPRQTLKLNVANNKAAIHPESRLVSRRADAHMRLRHVQVIDQKSLQQLLLDAREREFERIAARMPEPKQVKTSTFSHPGAILREVMHFAQQGLKKLAVYFS
ncbi:MAG TPA: hypothetical protein V6C81_02355 [Planktothrix sp.]|jgi:hypothetical protein